MSRKFIEKNAVNYLAILSFIWNKRKTLIVFFIIGSAIGFTSSKLSNKTYACSTTVVPNKSKTQSIKGLSGLASLAGINMGGMDGGEISPDLYNEVLKSYAFNHKILNSKMQFSQSDTLATIIEYFENIYVPDFSDYIKTYTIGLPGLIKSDKKTAKEDKNVVIDIFRYSTAEEKYRLKLEDMIQLETDEIKGHFTINVEFPDKLGSASITKKVTEILQDFVINVKINKAKDNYGFLLKRYDEEKEKFEKIQKKLAQFEDSNLNSVSAIVTQKRQAIKVKYNLRSQVFSEVSKQLESSRMTLQKDTPVFTIVKDVVAPNKKIKPSTIKSVFKWGVLFSFIFLIVIIGRKLKVDILTKT